MTRDGLAMIADVVAWLVDASMVILLVAMFAVGAVVVVCLVLLVDLRDNAAGQR